MSDVKSISNPATAARNISTWFASNASEFMKFTWLRLGLIIALLVLFNIGGVVVSDRVMVKTVVPPSYRHMDELGLKSLIQRMLEVKKVGPETILVMGDCITFGHGVKSPYTTFMEIPGRNILNISMQSINMNLMLYTIGAAHAMGVNEVVIQLHPIENYSHEEKSWTNLVERYPFGENVSQGHEFNANTLLQQSQKIWYRQVIAKNLFTSTNEVLSFVEWSKFSSLIRYDLVPNLPLYRDRYLIDFAGPKISYFSSRTNRIDSYRGHITPENQIKILHAKKELWENFNLSEDNTYHNRIVKSSAPARMAAYMREVGMKGTFFLAPTFVDKITEHTILDTEDFEIMRTALKEAVVQHGARFIDFLDDPEFGANMHHYDNLSVKGHKLLGERLSAIYRARPADE